MLSRWIANLPLRHKFAVLGFVALLMAIVPSYMVLRDAMANLQVLNLEDRGLVPSQALLNLIKLTQEHRGLTSAVLSGDASKQAARQERQADVDKAWAAASHDVSDLGNDKLNTAATTLQQAWHALASDVASGSVSAADGVKRHTKLISEQLAFLEDVVDATGLALDSDAESYYLITAAFRDWPRMIEKLGQARARGTAMLVKKAPKQEDSQALLALLEGARTHGEDALRDVDKSGVSKLAGLQDLQVAFDTAKAALGKGRTLVEGVAHAEDMSNMDPSAYFKDMTDVIKVQFAVSEQIQKRLDFRLSERVSEQRGQLAFTACVLLALTVLGAWFCITVTRVTTRTVAEAVEVAQALAQGDLRQQLHSDQRDEVGDLVRAMGMATMQLKQIILGIKTTSESVATASSEIANGNLDLSSRTEQQASSLQQTASSMEEMSATVSQNVTTAQSANQLAMQASSEATHSGEIFSQVVAKMAAIKHASSKIAEINAVIDGIAFQTNILALNAAVEAARAGEQGRGFAVVAAEVRSLAQRSAQAAKEIKTLITNSTESVDAGYGLATETGQSIERLVSQVQQVSQLMADIASGSEQQHQGITQVNQAVGQLEQATQQNAALVEQSSAAAASLSDQAMRLQDAIGQFRLV